MSTLFVVYLETPGADGYEPPETRQALFVLPAGADPVEACKKLEDLHESLARLYLRRHGARMGWYQRNPAPSIHPETAHQRAELEAWRELSHDFERKNWLDALRRPPTLTEQLLIDAWPDPRQENLRFIAEPLRIHHPE